MRAPKFTADQRTVDQVSQPGPMGDRHSPAWLWVVTLAVFGLVATSGRLTPFPIVLSDEANYLLATLHGYRKENFDRWEIVAAIPDHLFYAIYSTLAGPDLYARAKLLNAALIAASAYPIYAVARSCLSVRESAWLAALGVSAPVTSYARYFMPESLYYLGFWCAVWVTVKTVGKSVWLAALVAGVVLALLSFVKPHAVALAVGIGSFFLLRSGPWPRRLGPAAMMIVVFFIGRALLSYYLAGTIEVWPTGSAYSRIIGSPFAAAAVLFNGTGHLAALFVLAGFPLVVLVRALFQYSEQEELARDLALLAICVVVSLVVMTIYFSATVYAIAPDSERITRLHGRYYTFALPLVMIAYAATTRYSAAALISPRKMVPWVFATIASLLVIAGRYETSVVDYPELSLLTRWRSGVLLGTIAAGACLAATLLSRKYGGGVLLRAVPVVWWGAVGVTTSLALLAAPLAGIGFTPNAVDQAMTANPVLQMLHGHKDVMVVGTRSDAVDTFRVLFYLASLARARIVDASTVIGPEAIPGMFVRSSFSRGFPSTDPATQSASAR